MNKVSIIMGIFNCEKYLNKSIDSILNQTYKDWEFIICDDGSADNSLKIAKEYESKYPDKFKIIKNEKNMGLNYTLNECLKIAKGDYIARQDGDDISEWNRLEKEVKFLNKNQEYGFVSSNMIFFDEKGEWGSSHNKECPSKTDFIKGSPFCHAPCMIRKEVLKKVNGYTVSEKLLRVEDYHLWYKIYKHGYIGYNIQENLYKMRDNKNAYKRRNYKNRLNEYYLKRIIYKDYKIPFKMIPYVYKPIIMLLIPRRVYYYLHRKKLYKE